MGTDLRTEACRLKAAISLPTMIAQTLELKRSGRWFAGVCPFHAERTPSFYVYPDHYHCFGCGAHGDVFDWLARVCDLTFPEAVRRLALDDGRSLEVRSQAARHAQAPPGGVGGDHPVSRRACLA
jgi:DNA primase